MSKKVLAAFLAVVMVLGTMPVLALFSSAGEQEVKGTITRGDTGADVTEMLSDGSTSGYLDISWADNGAYTWSFDEETSTLTVGGAKVGTSSMDQTNYAWHSLRSQVKKVVVLPGTKEVGRHAFTNMKSLSEVIIGEGVTTLGMDAFSNCGSIVMSLPSTIETFQQGVVYNTTVSKVVLNNMTAAEFGELTFGDYNENAKNAPKEEKTFEPITVGKYSNGWENWVGGTGGEQTELLTMLTGADGATFSPSGTYTWKVTLLGGSVTAGEGGIAKTLTFSKPSSIAGQINRFEVCLGEGDNQFIPQKGARYTVAVQLFDESGELKYSGISEAGAFYCNMDPIYTEKTYGPIFANNNCYVEVDFGSPVSVCKLMLANYVNSTRYYQWEAYGSDDNTAPIDEWTYLGGKKDESTSTAEGYTVTIDPVGAAYNQYQYVRVYGTFDSANGGYHFTELKTWIYVGGDSVPVTWVTGDGQQVSLVEKGESPVFTGSTDKTPQYDTAYEFAGWTDGQTTYGPSDPLPPAKEAITYTAVYKETTRPARTLSVSIYNNITVENWNNETQILFDISGVADDPTYDRKVLTSDVENKTGRFRWVWTFSWNDGDDHTETHTITPSSLYDFNPAVLFRVTPLCGNDVFLLEKDVKYKVNVEIYDMSVDMVEKYGAEGYHVYTTNNQNSIEYSITAAAPITHTYHTVTWQLDGTTVYTAKVQDGVVPTFPGTPYADIKEDGGKFYKLSVPQTTAVTADVTYNMIYEELDTKKLTVGTYGTGWENWPANSPQTQLLLTFTTWNDGNFSDIYANKALYDWVLTINGQEYTVEPSSNSVWGTKLIIRFTPCLGDGENQFIPQANTTYTISVTLYNKGTKDVAYYTGNSVETKTSADFVPVVPEPTYEDGDVNGDGSVSIDDVTALLDYLAADEAGQLQMIEEGTVIEEQLNLDGDDQVSVSDVTALLNILGELDG